jgi:AraC-like DNA-binding protein
MITREFIQDVLTSVAERGALGVGCETAVDGLFAFADPDVSDCRPSYYEPIMCLVLQGAKEARIGGRLIRYSAGDTLLVSHAVHVESAIVEASQEAPYVALALKLDLALARSLYDEIGGIGAPTKELHSMCVEKGEAPLIDAVMRLYKLSEDPVEARALAPLVLKEIHFRLLRAKHGTMLRQLLRHESAASRISKAIAFIRLNFKTQIPVADLAAETGMSLSAFHEHFKAVTSTTPLQYQKDLRLMEARRLLSIGSLTVAATAYDVGYESPTQFSREYSRKFGMSPSDHRGITSIVG